MRWCLVEDRACKRSERHPVKVMGRAQYRGKHQVKWVEEVDEGETEHPVKTDGYARQGERPVMMVGHARAEARRRPTAIEGAQRQQTASDGGSEAVNVEGRAPGEGGGAN